MIWTATMTPTIVLEVGTDSTGELYKCKNIKLSDSIKRYTYPSLNKAIPQTKFELNIKVIFDDTNKETSKQTCESDNTSKFINSNK